MTGAATYFLDTKFGSHTFKFGGEIYNETQWGGRAQNVGGNIEHIYNNGVASQVVFGVPTAPASAAATPATTASCSSSTSSISRTSSSTTRGRRAA